MERFILRFQDAPAAPSDQVEWIKRHCRVVDESRRMLLVEAPDQASVDAMLAELRGWKVSREVQYRSPEPPLKIEKPTEPE